MGRQGRRGLRRDDERARGAPRGARRTRAVLDPHRDRGAAGARRHAEDALPHPRRPSGRGGADALPRRPPLDLRLVAVRLPAHLHVLRHRRDAVRPQPDAVGDPRPGAPLPPARGDRPLRLHGHGRAVHQLRQRDRGRAAAAGSRHHAATHDDLHRRLDARPDAVHRRGRRADPARALAPRGEPRPPLVS